jgi:hypothetical protein
VSKRRESHHNDEGGTCRVCSHRDHVSCCRILIRWCKRYCETCRAKKAADDTSFTEDSERRRTVKEEFIADCREAGWDVTGVGVSRIPGRPY